MFGGCLSVLGAPPAGKLLPAPRLTRGSPDKLWDLGVLCAKIVRPLELWSSWHLAVLLKPRRARVVTDLQKRAFGKSHLD